MKTLLSRLTHLIFPPSSFLLIAAAVFLSAAAAGAEYPSRPIRIVVPHTPGGFTDVTTRIVGSELSKSFGQNIIIDNRPGANSIVGVDLVAKSTPDGYTLVSVIPAHAANQTLYPKLPYHSVKSFAPVSLAVSAPLILCVTNAFPANSVKDLIALAKSNRFLRDEVAKWEKVIRTANVKVEN